MANRYCSMTDVENRWSQEGVDLRLDDGPLDTDGDVLDNAGSMIEEYCRQRYTVAQLQSSEWIKQRATDIAAYLLGERRGNGVPGGIARAFEQYVGLPGSPGRLEMVRLGRLHIPDVGMRKTEVPVLSQPRVQLSPIPHVVIEQRRSTGNPEGYRQSRDLLDAVTVLDYSI